jgi:hypothetical protein
MAGNTVWRTQLVPLYTQFSIWGDFLVVASGEKVVGIGGTGAYMQGF